MSEDFEFVWFTLSFFHVKIYFGEDKVKLSFSSPGDSLVPNHILIEMYRSDVNPFDMFSS
jgi:hypothetical protein